MHLTAPAKINLYLHITGRRPDGYHELDSLAAFLDFGDELVLEESEELKLELSGPFSKGLSDKNNLALDAARLIKKNLGIDRHVSIRLKKNIPFGAGLGGGSSDAAAVLLALNAWWKLGLSDQQLAEMAMQLGSDVAVCLGRKPAYIRGVGEVIEPCNYHLDAPVLLVNPRIVLPTVSVYKAFRGVFRPPHPKLKQEGRGALIAFLKTTSNDLTDPAITLCPAIGDILDALNHSPRHLFSRMSGSGSTCFGFYEDAKSALLAMEWFRKQYPAYWYHVTHLRSYA